MRALVILVLLAGTAHAQSWRELQGGAFLHYELSTLTVVDEHVDRMADARASQLVLAGARLHGFLARNASVAYHVGVDLAFGSTLGDAGFAYDVALFPAGVVVRAGRSSILGVGVGIGGSGAVGTIDDAVTVPVEAIAEVGTRHVRLLARARVAYVAAADSRQSAAPSVPFADELDAMLGVRLGWAYDKYGMASGNGYFVAASYRELAGVRFAGITIGYSLDGATRRRR